MQNIHTISSNKVAASVIKAVKDKVKGIGLIYVIARYRKMKKARYRVFLKN